MSASHDESAPIRVEAPARLHLGFLDPGASLGRRYGSIGLAIDGLVTRVDALAHGELEVSGADAGRARVITERVLGHYGLPPRLRLTVDAAIPAHAGLGSGTQLALAVATAVTRLFGQHRAAAELAAVLERGRRSGIGLNLFEHGGLVVDGGRGVATRTPPLLSRVAVPAAWRVVLVCDDAAAGLSGGDELAAFKALPSFGQAAAAHLCHLTLMQILPAAAEGDFPAFARAVGEVQALLGDHFANVQSGRFTSARVGRAIEFLARECQLAGIGQSSWGPTGFAFAADAATAHAALARLELEPALLDGLAVRVCALRNDGARVHDGRERARRAAL